MTRDHQADCTRPFALQLFPDAVWLAPDERESLLADADLSCDASGPKNERFEQSARDAEPPKQSLMERCQRPAPCPGSSAIRSPGERSR